ncbi:MAG: hemo-binding uptake, Tiki superfamily, ChaN [Firmicutes bacterium]|nr:hemo-binding uptake, Tiki superfamily, ChaN [Bacillota bacterium]
MAESIAHYIKQNPAKKVLHVQGDFHSHNRLGVVEKLQALEPTLKIGVITPVHNDINVQQEKADLFLVVEK